MERLDPEMKLLAEQLNQAIPNSEEKMNLETRFKRREEMLAGVYHQVDLKNGERKSLTSNVISRFKIL